MRGAAVGPGGRVLILTHLVPEVTRDTLVRVLGILAQRDIRVVMTGQELAKHGEALRAAGCEFEEWGDECLREQVHELGLCLVLGGDGTTLRALHLTGGAVPVAGVNLGRVGFLSTISVSSLEAELARVLDGEGVVHGLPALRLSGEGGAWSGAIAFNDVFFGRLPEQTVCRLGFRLGGVDLYDLRCDGLVAATPIGSSAYNLSAGGPVLGLGLRGYVISYVAAHSLKARSIVAEADDVLEVINTSVREPVMIVVDGEDRGRLVPGRSARLTFERDAGRLSLLPQDGLYRNFRDRFLS